MILSAWRRGRLGMKQTAWSPPVWLLGLCNFPLGVSGAVTFVALPQLLAANGVPESRIAFVTTLSLIPSFCTFLLSPILDWRFTRRFYAIVFAGLSALLLFESLVFIREFAILAILLFLGSAAVSLYTPAIGGWFGNLISS